MKKEESMPQKERNSQCTFIGWKKSFKESGTRAHICPLLGLRIPNTTASRSSLCLCSFWPWNSCVLRYSTQNQGKTKLLRNLNALSRDTLAAWGARESMCECVCVCACLCACVCVIWPGDRRSETTLEGREKAASAVWIALLCRLVGSLQRWLLD